MKRHAFLSFPLLLPGLLGALLITVPCCKNRLSSKEKEPLNKAVNPPETWALLPFVKVDSINPVLVPGTGQFTCPVLNRKIKWENKDVFNPAVVISNGKVYMLYRAEDTIGKFAGTSRIGLAESSDGFHFSRKAEPVLFPMNDSLKRYEWEGGVEDPRVVENDAGTYFMTYTAYDGSIARLMVASSKDLVHWVKHGRAFAHASAVYADTWSKSGSIVSKYVNGKIVAAKINGSYIMYWGDTNIWAATSDDLINWMPVELPPSEQKEQQTAGSELRVVIAPRKGMFDSDLVEPGPPAMLTDKGILLIYNSRNIPAKGDTSLAEGTYAAGQVLLDKDDPYRVLQRMEKYFIKPEKPYEIAGQVNQVCFVEGLVNFKKHWFLYYGTADSKIAVAVKDRL